MSDAIKQWNEALASSQRTLLEAIFPALPEGAGVFPKLKLDTTLQDEFADLQATWAESIEKWTAFMKESSGKGSPTPEAIKSMFSPTSWGKQGLGIFESTLQHVIEGPKYATLWDLERKLARLQRLLIQRDQDVLTYQGIVQRAWNTALARFAESFRSATEPPPETWRAATDRWLAIANDVLVETYRTDEFVEAQRRMLRASSDYRIQEREIAEAWCEALHIPTRGEMDEVQRSVIELRRQVRLLQRQAMPNAGRASGAAAKSIRAKPKSRRSTARA